LRLDHRQCGQGHATEEANAALECACDQLACVQLSRLRHSTERSIAVMQQLGMTRDPVADVDHPAVSDDRLRRHVLYRVCRAVWGAREPNMSAVRSASGQHGQF
jgi:RimJ/RimL family protein N-acetyltransferase